MRSDHSVKLDRTKEWRSGLAIWTAGFLMFECLSGLSIWLLPFSIPNQIMVVVHTVAGLLFLAPCSWYLIRHWLLYRTHMMTHVKLLGYIGLFVFILCAVSGVILTVQAALGTKISYPWDTIHIITTFALLAFIVPHIVLIVPRDRRAKASESLAPVLAAVKSYALGTLLTTVVFFAVVLLGTYAYDPVQLKNEFDPDYSFKYGQDRPFAPSLARTHTGTAFDARSLSGSKSCGTAGCHEQIVKEWRVSAHGYSAMDIGFQKIQLTMAEQNGPESTRYCGGCHDPISLFSGTKNIFTDPEKLSSLRGYEEGVSCLTCHAIRETDLKGNAQYVITQPQRYIFEIEYGEKHSEFTRFLRDFLIRAYPRHHVNSLSKRLFKAPEYCAACHKQFIDKEINNVGWVQLQNQYDNWRKSRWNHPENPTKTIECRECHMPLVESQDPSAGDVLDRNRSPDDGMHRSHRFVAANQLMPKLLQLPGWEKQVELTEKWLRGEYEIPEIADKWTQGPVVSLQLVAPEMVREGDRINLKTIITSNKVGHDFPTGPLDIIQSWVELIVRDDQGQEIYATGRVDGKGFIQPGSFIFKAEPVDQYGNLIDRHNLWEMVGVRHRRALFPGFSDTADFSFSCPGLNPSDKRLTPALEQEKSHPIQVPRQAAGQLHVTARLLYRKIDQYLLNFIFGEDAGLTSPITEMSSDQAIIQVVPKESR
ncbi:MAG: multiheme c-type cytochrome [Acidobacteriota bacterium]